MVWADVRARPRRVIMRSGTVAAGIALAAFAVIGSAAFQADAADTYDKEATEVILARAARSVKANCGHAKDENGKAVGPWGKTKVAVKLGHNGRSKGATVP